MPKAKNVARTYLPAESVSPETLRQITRLRDLIARGKTLTEASRGAKISVATGYRRCIQFLPDIDRTRHRPLTVGERERAIAALERGVQSLRRIAVLLGRDVHVISRIRDDFYGTADDENTEIEISNLRTAKICGGCGYKIKTSPCLICDGRKRKGSRDG